MKTGISMVAVLGVAILVSAQARREQLPFEVFQVRPNVYLIGGAGGNIVAQTGADGVVLVDTGSTTMAERVLAELKKVTQQPIRYIINTSADADHVGGNDRLAAAGVSLIPGAGGGFPGGAVSSAVNNGGGAAILSHENVLARMSAPTGKASPFPTSAWPSTTFGEDEKDIFLNGEGIQVFHQPAAHSDGDSLVFFRKSDVVVAGEVLDTTRFPVIDLARGGSIQGELSALNRIIDLTVPEIPLRWQEGGTYVVPGHGRVCDEADVVEYRDAITIVRDVIADMIQRGMTLEQVKNANPTIDYRPRYGADSGNWTTDMFVEAIYKSLSGKK